MSLDKNFNELLIQPDQEWFWSTAWQQAEKEVEEDLAAGRYETFDTMDEFLADIDQGEKSCH